jgi:hypothetical protein
MARDLNGSTDRIDYTAISTALAQAQTFSAWLFVDAHAANLNRITGIAQSGDTANGHSFGILSTGAVFYRVVHSTTILNHDSSTTISTGQWVHALYTWDGSKTAANIHIYLDNAEVSYATTTDGVGTEASIGSWCLGGNIFNDSANFNGRMAAIGWWNRILTAAEIEALSEGYSPLFFRRGLGWSPQLIRSQQDPITGQAGTLDGTTVIEHPRIIMPSSSSSRRYAAPVAAGGTWPGYYGHGFY